jgi:hypothetical protein
MTPNRRIPRQADRVAELPPRRLAAARGGFRTIALADGASPGDDPDLRTIALAD